MCSLHSVGWQVGWLVGWWFDKKKIPSVYVLPLYCANMVQCNRLEV